MESEDDLVHWLKERAAGLGGELIGDDAALLPAGGPSVVTVDQQIENVHFLPGLDPGILARRLLAVNLSDLAAMGARPTYGFLTLAAPPSWDRKSFFNALLDACRPLGLKLAGGDLARRPEPAVSLTLIGHGEEGQSHFLHRHQARSGDRLWLGGPVGEAALGFDLQQRGARMDGDGTVHLGEGLSRFLDPGNQKVAERAIRRHLCPQPQLDLGRQLVQLGVRAAMDVSDGLAKDLHRMCRASKVAAHLDLGSLTPDPELAQLARLLDRDPAQLALEGGEDYVLCFTLAPSLEAPKGCRAIGEIRAGSGVFDLQGQPIQAAGWDHLQTK